MELVMPNVYPHQPIWNRIKTLVTAIRSMGQTYAINVRVITMRPLWYRQCPVTLVIPKGLLIT